ncbi:hypothetical protein HRR83_008618 [Exophiala dermatitidis]|nr:hypothetical protein HRR73_008433 [Exophiala dermatitidis]KAJ4536605.1 hypothetical protein HRR76_004639 [Exophiala dermatitidis]KAJ4559459.1 hypothetical protein HRR79_008236 [Exophiala dermatitidis]KAJ4566143.1 hypothetical protein HRR82_008729 [Exophiala dermatitidis]KAJ4588326.1 hypothetical protein HRR83_008618 [Exophiala dermatitidis]
MQHAIFQRIRGRVDATGDLEILVSPVTRSESMSTNSANRLQSEHCSERYVVFGKTSRIRKRYLMLSYPIIKKIKSTSPTYSDSHYPTPEQSNIAYFPVK